MGVKGSTLRAEGGSQKGLLAWSSYSAKRPFGQQRVPGSMRRSHGWSEPSHKQARLDLDSQQEANAGKTTNTVRTTLMTAMFVRSSAVSPVQPIQAP